MGRWLTPDAPADGFICRLLRIPNSEECLAIVNGALMDLGYPHSFEQFGDLSPAEVADLFAQMYDYYVSQRGCMIGTIFAHASGVAPTGSLACDGAGYLRADYPLLYDVLASAYHTDSTHFVVPDLRGRVSLGTGTGTGLTARSINQSGGEEVHVLSVSEMPAHTHTYVNHTSLPTSAPGSPAGSVIANPISTTSSAGGDGAHQNMQPWLALNYAIWAQ